jgi:hypothetical protein
LKNRKNLEVTRQQVTTNPKNNISGDIPPNHAEHKKQYYFQNSM